MGRITSGISQIGGKYRLVNKLLSFTPYHEFFLSMFLGAAHFELNKPRCRYECWNDIESEIINYLLQIREHSKEFDEMKQGVFGLVSQEIGNRIVNGKIKPKNDLERAYYFYYLNKITFEGSVQKGYCGLNQNRAIPQSTFHEKDVNEIKAKFRGLTLPTVCKDKSVNEAKIGYMGIMGNFKSGQVGVEKAKTNFGGITPKISYKGIGPKTTRPYTNNDCGLLSPINPEAIKRLRYVNLTVYDFRKVYKMFYKAFHVRKGLKRECFIYEDPPYPGTEKYYGKLFEKEFHQNLIDINLESPFNILQSIGGKCGFYIDSYKDAGWNIIPIKVKYSTDANSQKESQEYFCMNYNIKKVPKMIMDNQPDIYEYI